MNPKFRPFIGLVLALLLVSPVFAQGPVEPQHSDPFWQVAYWNNMTLSGDPVVQDTNTHLDWDWGNGSPHPSVNVDQFSARWLRYIDVSPGTYRFTATSDDGIRVWVDGELLIDRWIDQPPTTYTAEKYLAAGHHLVKVDYYENQGGAVARLSWELSVDDDQLWRGEYYNNKTLSGSPGLVRRDPEINFSWGSGSPAPGQIDADVFSVRWTRSLDLPANHYRFRMTVDDGARLYVNGHLLIDTWKDQSPHTYTGDIYLPGGSVPVQMEYYENMGNATAQLSWAPVDESPILGWQGEYFDNTYLGGSPVLVRDDTAINFEWGSGSPAPGLIGSDRFSARWTRSLDLPAGTYRFTMRVDDGGRLYVNDRLLIDTWKDQSPHTYTGDIYLPGGSVPVQMEYYENMGNATAQLSWAPVDESPILVWQGEYFDNTYLGGSPVLVRDDAAINFEWGSGSPAPGLIGSDRFSARWTRSLDLPAGTYRFTMRVDDGGRLYINDRLLINTWKDQPPTTYTTDTYHPGGLLDARMEYYENGGNATAQLSWKSVTSPPTDVVIVDDTDPGFVKGGSSTGWRTAYEGYGGHLTWTWNSDHSQYNNNWGRWYPELAAGSYEVLVYIPERYTTTSNARYWIAHADGFTLKVVDQSANGDRWVSLGTHRFLGADGEYVSLADVTYEADRSRLIAFDAVKWVPQK